MLLADLGADVVRVGRRPDDPPDPGELCWSRNKRQVELDPGDDAVQCGFRSVSKTQTT